MAHTPAMALFHFEWKDLLETIKRGMGTCEAKIEKTKLLEDKAIRGWVDTIEETDRGHSTCPSTKKKRTTWSVDLSCSQFTGHSLAGVYSTGVHTCKDSTPQPPIQFARPIAPKLPQAPVGDHIRSSKPLPGSPSPYRAFGFSVSRRKRRPTYGGCSGIGH